MDEFSQKNAVESERDLEQNIENGLKKEKVNQPIRGSLEIMIEDKDFEDRNCGNLMKEKLLKLLLMIIYFVFIITLETTYRDSLFEESIQIEEDLEKGYEKTSFFFKFWKSLFQRQDLNIRIQKFIPFF